MFDMRKYASHLGRRLNSNERGAILIWLIFILVAAGILGSSMVYLTTSSTYDELLANNQARAYYIAEAGGRFAVPQMIKDRITAFANLNGNTFTLHHSGFGDKFMISDMDINPEPDEPMTVISTGIVNAGSWLEGRRTITYGIEKTYYEDGMDDPAEFPNLWAVMDNDLVGLLNDPAQTGGDWAVRFKNLGPDLKVSMGLNWDDNDIPNLAEARSDFDGLLSYDIQVKVKIDVGVPHGNHYMAGLLFRWDINGDDIISNDSMYGISFFKSDNSNFDRDEPWNDPVVGELDSTFDRIFYEIDNDPPVPPHYKKYIVLWKKDPDPAKYTVLGYQWLNGSYGALGGVDGAGELNPWSTIVVRVLENGGGNTISVWVQGTSGYPRNTTAFPEPISWDFDKFKPVATWLVPDVPVPNPPTFHIVDNLNDACDTFTCISDPTFTSSNFDTLPNPPYPQEIGIHAFYDNQGNNNIYFDDFAVRLLSPDGSAYAKKPIQY